MLRIDDLSFGYAVHLELAAFDTKGETALDEVERVLAELFKAPAVEDSEVFPHARCKRLEIIGARNQPRCDRCPLNDACAFYAAR